MDNGGRLKENLGISTQKDVFDGVIEVAHRKTNSLLEAASSGPDRLRDFLTSEIKALAPDPA